MLKKWKHMRGEGGASYQVLWEALGDKQIGRKDLAEKFCSRGFLRSGEYIVCIVCTVSDTLITDTSQ